MRVSTLALVVGLSGGLVLGACGAFDKWLHVYCTANADRCTCSDAGPCCINDGFDTDDPKHCCSDLTTVPRPDGGLRCCALDGCLGPDGGHPDSPDAASAWPDGDGGLGAACTSWQDCWHADGVGGWACAYDGGSASCQTHICWVAPDGGRPGCGSQRYNTGVVTLSTGTDQNCGLPGYVGEYPCCYARGSNQGVPVSCLDRNLCALDGGVLWVSTAPAVACLP